MLTILLIAQGYCESKTAAFGRCFDLIRLDNVLLLRCATNYGQLVSFFGVAAIGVFLYL